MVKALFLDRDGTLNEDTMYPHKEEHFKMLPGVIEGLKKLKEEFIFIIVTNQSGIGRGIFEEKDMHNFNDILLEKLRKNDVEVKKIFFCPHSPKDVCECRKPSVKYIEEAAKEFDIDLEKSWTLGDHAHDVEMGLNSGTKAIYLLTGHGEKHFKQLEEKSIKPDFVAKDFLEATNFILNNG
ncbi:HAD family hydrolase [Candidatus Woesearchaeota archaeon]|nr:HAD family hydrolase [Candidatus Woesearchaeota archaeon]